MEEQTESPTLELATMEQITDEIHERHDAFVIAWVSGEGHHFQSNISIHQATHLYLSLAMKVAEEQDIPFIGDAIPVPAVIARRKRERAAYFAVALLTIVAVLELIIILSLLAERLR